MSKTVSATDMLLNPHVHAARVMGQQLGEIKASDITSMGGEEFASWNFDQNPEAALKAMARYVAEKSLGKAFGDDEVLNAIPEKRTASVTFFKMKDGSGIALANIQGGSEAMRLMLDRLTPDDLVLMPPPPPVRAPKNPPVVIGGVEYQPAGAEAKPRSFRSLSEEQVADLDDYNPVPFGAALPSFGSNPYALMTFLKQAWTAPTTAMPAPSAEDLFTASVWAATTEAAMDDETWPDGITVTDAKTGEAIKGPKQGKALFTAALTGDTAPVVSDDDLLTRIRTRGPK